jgi:deoxyribodipyrimidine photo-lyase
MSHVLVWFRRDLRLADNPALAAAIESGHTPIPIFIHDAVQDQWSPGAASAWWLHHSLVALQQSLRELCSDLLVFHGDAETIIDGLVQQHDCPGVYWNRCYEPGVIERDKRIKKALLEGGRDCQSFNASLLMEPWQHLKKDETPYRVFTPFWKALSARLEYFDSRPAPDEMPALSAKIQESALSIDELGLLPNIAWDAGIRETWHPGEAGAHEQLERFVETVIFDYPDGRDIPSKAGTSRLSPCLHFGEIGPRQIWNYVQQAMQQDRSTGVIKGGEAFLREVGWREFSYHLLFHFPQMPDHPLDKRFENFPWRTDYAGDLRRWQQGQTGIPIVDAGMRELWTTGWMHNRVRMIVASLLTKNLLIPWQEGERWFWDTLVDADLANNAQGWQWTAGCGVDAAPYFRIFNPVLQGERFDADGVYIRQWVPELSDLPKKWIHKPWQAPADILAEAGVLLGKDYPEPVVDLAGSRQRALECWDRVKKQGK